MDIAIISPEESAINRVRLYRLISVLRTKENVKIEFWGWQRNITRQDEAPGINLSSKMILRRPINGKVGLLDYIYWMIAVSIKALFSPKKDLFYCVGLDSAFPLAIISSLRKVRYIFDNADNLYMSHKWPVFIRWMLKECEEFAVSHSIVQIVPGISRISVKSLNKSIVVRNCPTNDILSKAWSIAQNKSYTRTDKFRIYINGLLTEERGSKQIYSALMRLSNVDFELIICGELKSKSAEMLTQLPQSKYLGKVGYIEALSLYYCSYLCITLYDPSIEINRRAESNKWCDCEATGTKFVANQEIETLSYYKSIGLCETFQYNDVDQLVNIIKKEYENYKLGLKWQPVNAEKRNTVSIEDFVDKYIVEKV